MLDAPLFDPQRRRPVDLNHASRLVSHGPTIMVGALHDRRRNIMAAVWSMPVEFTPPRIAVVLDKSTWTRELAIASGTLALMVPCLASADLTFTVGSVGGKALHDEGTDKFARYGIGTFDGPVFGMPLATDCIAWLDAACCASRVSRSATTPSSAKQSRRSPTTASSRTATGPSTRHRPTCTRCTTSPPATSPSHRRRRRPRCRRCSFNGTIAGDRRRRI